MIESLNRNSQRFMETY
jgi:hypothetical protein